MEYVTLVMQVLLAVIGGLLTFVIYGFRKTLDKLTDEDGVLHKRITEYREDMLANYPTNSKLDRMQDKLMARVDKLESVIVSLLGQRRNDRHVQD